MFENSDINTMLVTLLDRHIVWRKGVAAVIYIERVERCCSNCNQCKSLAKPYQKTNIYKNRSDRLCPTK